MVIDVFPALIQDGSPTPDWKYVRQWTGYYTNGPIADPESPAIRCNVDGDDGSKTETLSVAAGSTIGFTAESEIGHPGPMLVYMAQAPGEASAFDGSGESWFKIYEDGPGFGGGELTWPSEGATEVTFDLPAALPNGDYLIRVEHIALHTAGSEGGAQFYVSCGQVTVTDGGDGTPEPLVAFPGAYSPTDPGILINIYSPVPTNYTAPGPAILCLYAFVIFKKVDKPKSLNYGGDGMMALLKYAWLLTPKIDQHHVLANPFFEKAMRKIQSSEADPDFGYRDYDPNIKFPASFNLRLKSTGSRGSWIKALQGAPKSDSLRVGD
ncbi:hypothetical protein FQN54_008761 [Arachnomyces sp. PD_36]|nr:hypothetical protein FQN54_008761 [Arachnomyces sp. PD_36]